MSVPLHPPRLLRFRIASLVFTILGFPLLLSGTALGASSITTLGRPSDSVSPLESFPLSGFHRIKQDPERHHLPVFMFIGTLLDGDLPSAKERWPVVKSLAQFGSFQGVQSVERKCKPWPGAPGKLCGIPTFDWSRAIYRSHYLVFDHKDLLNPHGGYFQKLTSAEHSLFMRYAHHSGGTRPDPQNIGSSVNSPDARALPLVVIGGYLQSRSQLISTNDFQEQVQMRQGEFIGSGLSFSVIHDALISGIDPAGTQLNADVDAEANIITALICHADRNQPARVCNRPVITRIRHAGQVN